MKHIHRFFVPDTLHCGARVPLSAADSFHAARVLRLRAGDAVELAGGEGRVFTGAIAPGALTGNDTVAVDVDEELAVAVAGAAAGGAVFSVVQALPRGRKMDLVAEKLSELGVDQLAPVISDRSVAREVAGREGKLERWRRVARAAAAQAKRTQIMEIHAPQPLTQWLSCFSGDIMVLTTEVEGMPLGAAMTALLESGADAMRPLALVVGPEAGFSPAEIAALDAGGAVFVSLGSLVLRTETAALVAATIVRHHMGAIG
ncbi:MAG: RsmE family RNA methyltransferase [Thermoleophilia bacterium]